MRGADARKTKIVYMSITFHSEPHQHNCQSINEAISMTLGLSFQLNLPDTLRSLVEGREEEQQESDYGATRAPRQIATFEVARRVFLEKKSPFPWIESLFTTRQSSFLLCFFGLVLWHESANPLEHRTTQITSGGHRCSPDHRCLMTNLLSYVESSMLESERGF